jgi:aryl-alcohol dehydrogenase-like predicted oxidoreductase
MNYQTIPNTQLSVAEICLGCGDMGGGLDQSASYRLLDYYVSQGGNFFDTAHVYNNWLPGEKSRSEKLIGAWLKERRCRGRIVLATKGGHFPVDGAPYVNRANPREILIDLHESLEFLQTDCVDLYWLHRDDPAQPVADLLTTLEKAREQGKIRYYGASNWRPARIREAAAFAQANHMSGFIADQMLWSAARADAAAIPDQTIMVMNDELFDLHRQTGLPAITYTSQANGLFAKMAAGTLESQHASLLESFPLEPNRRRYAHLQRVMQQTGLNLSQVVLGWLLSQPFVTIPIVGPKRIEQLADSLSASGVRLTSEQVHLIASDSPQ